MIVNWRLQLVEARAFNLKTPIDAEAGCWISSVLVVDYDGFNLNLI